MIRGIFNFFIFISGIPIIYCHGETIVHHQISGPSDHEKDLLLKRSLVDGKLVDGKTNGTQSFKKVKLQSNSHRPSSVFESKKSLNVKKSKELIYEKSIGKKTIIVSSKEEKIKQNHKRKKMQKIQQYFKNFLVFCGSTWISKSAINFFGGSNEPPEQTKKIKNFLIPIFYTGAPKEILYSEGDLESQRKNNNFRIVESTKFLTTLIQNNREIFKDILTEKKKKVYDGPVAKIINPSAMERFQYFKERCHGELLRILMKKTGLTESQLKAKRFYYKQWNFDGTFTEIKSIDLENMMEIALGDRDKDESKDKDLLDMLKNTLQDKSKVLHISNVNLFLLAVGNYSLNCKDPFIDKVFDEIIEALNTSESNPFEEIPMENYNQLTFFEKSLLGLKKTIHSFVSF
jgi:hypothetical protein